MTRHPTTITAEPGLPYIDIEREFDAAPAQVLRAHTDPALVVQWLGPRDLTTELTEWDARSGGGYRFTQRDAGGGEYRFHGVFHTVAPELIVRTFEFAGAPGEVSLERTAFEDLGGGRTRLRTRSVFPSVQTRDAMHAAGMERGVIDSMDRIEELFGAEAAAAAERGVSEASEASGAAPAPAPAGRVVVDITVSLDGFVTAPGAGLEHGLGIDGRLLHDWARARKTPLDEELMQRTFERTGAVVMGRRTFEIVDGPNGWREDLGYGADRDQTDAPPVFVLTGAVPETVRLAERFRFITDGLDHALAEARAAADGKDVVVMGGGETARSFLRSGRVDVLSLHVAPVLLGAGTPLFPLGADLRLRLEQTGSLTTDAAHHLTYRVLPVEGG